MSFQDILAAIAVVINGLPQGLLALTFGFAAFPTALAFLVGPIGMVVFGQIAPISFQAESIVLAGTLGKDRDERLNIVFFTGITMAIIGGVSLASAILTYFITDDLVYTIVASVFVSSIIWIFLKKDKKNDGNNEEVDLKYEKLIPLKIKVNYNIIRSVLALITMQIGGNIAYASITGSLANRATNVDYVTLYSGIGDAISAFFGGGPVEAIISGTAVAPSPLWSGVIMMLIMAAILFARLLPRIAKYVPSESIAGFLLVLGAIIVFPVNIGLGIEANPVIAGITTIVTASTDPFIGMVSGIIVRFLINVF